jgi:para-nitrobenzyl esterase
VRGFSSASAVAWTVTRCRVGVVVVAVAAAVTGTATATAQPDAGRAPALVDAPVCADGTTVSTDRGPVCGLSDGERRQWLGIPFAAPPVGELRWHSPQPHAAWTAMLPATTPGSGCPQPNAGPASFPSTNEDCLYLNVTAPADSGSTPLPVLVFLHGGAFFVGAGSIYDGSFLAVRAHAVVVTVNYRLGIVGFLAHPALGAQAGDYGLQDQQAALRWVRRNIAEFGGDPGNITLWGQSAGASSVCHQLVSPAAAGLFHKAIIESGEYNLPFGGPGGLAPQDCQAELPTQAQAEAAGAVFAANVGCAGAADAAACLRAVPVATLLSTPGGTRAPTVNATTLPAPPREAFTRGPVNHVDAVLAGVARDENLAGSASTAAEYEALIASQYGPAAPQVLARYPLSRFPSPFVAARTVHADSNTVCPALTAHRQLSRWTRLYAYQMDDADAVPDGIYQNAAMPNGAYHVAEMQFFFPGLFVRTPLSPNQQVLAGQVVAEWAAFAHTGNPNAAGTPAWPRFTRASHQVLSLQPAGDSEIDADIAVNHQCAFWDRLGR